MDLLLVLRRNHPSLICHLSSFSHQRQFSLWRPRKGRPPAAEARSGGPPACHVTPSPFLICFPVWCWSPSSPPARSANTSLPCAPGTLGAWSSPGIWWDSNMCQLSSLDLPAVPMLRSFHHHCLESGFPVTSPVCGILGTSRSAFLPSSRGYFLLVACDWDGDNTCLCVNMTGVWSKWFLSDFPTTRELMKELERETHTHWRITSIPVATRRVDWING